MKFKNIKTLIIREYWEHKSLLFRTPLILSLILIAITAISTYKIVQNTEWQNSEIDISFIEENTKESSPTIQLNKDNVVFDGKNHSTVSNMIKIDQVFNAAGLAEEKSLKNVTNAIGAGILVPLIFSIAISFLYLTQSLYSDRKDKSILFWKSLPVMEWENIIAKLLTGMWVFPVIFIAIASVASIIAFIIIYLGISTMGFNNEINYIISHGSRYFLSNIHQVIFFVIVLIISLIPIYSWLLFSSALAKRSPMLIAFGIPISLIVIEGISLQSFTIANHLQNYILALAKNANEIGYFNFSEVMLLPYAIGICISVVLLFSTEWLRKNRYEL